MYTQVAGSMAWTAAESGKLCVVCRHGVLGGLRMLFVVCYLLPCCVRFLAKQKLLKGGSGVYEGGGEQGVARGCFGKFNVSRIGKGLG